MTAVITISLVYMVLLVGFFIYKVASSDREKRLRFLKGFKKGKFAFIYLSAILLFTLASYNDGLPIWGAILTSIKNTIDLVLLKYNYSVVAPLMESNLYYRITVDICFILVALNAIVFTLAIFGEKAYNWLLCQKTYKKEKKVYVILGDNAQNRSIIKSAKEENIPVLLLVENITENIRDYAFVEKIALDRYKKDIDIGAQIVKSFSNIEEKLINVFVNTEEDRQDILFVEKISKAIMDNWLEKLSYLEDRGLNCYVFGEPENASAFGIFVSNTKGCVRYVNKYRQIAMDFVGKYPLTQFMTEEQIDYDTATIRPTTEINVVMIGFGKTNRHIFSTSVANNQFITFDSASGKVKEKAVNYYVFDNRNAECDKNLNHDYFRYSREYPRLLNNKDKYLSLPTPPANEQFYKIDVNDGVFYDTLNSCLTNGENNAYNYVIIAYGSDMENLDFADKICAKLIEWNVKKHTKVFVKIRDDILSQEVVKPQYVDKDKFIVFGSESETVYNVKQIVSEKYERMAKDKHLTYIFANNASNVITVTDNQGNQVKYEGEPKTAYLLEEANRQWYEKWAQVQRDSNTFACLSIRSKLHLLGYDFVKGTGEDKSEEFFTKYQQGDPIIYLEKTSVMGRKEVDYGDCNFVTNTIRNNFAYQEHLRWNAYHICCGYLPATIEETLSTDKQSLIDIRKHRNLLSYEGLIEYAQLLSSQNGKPYKDNDVIKYDYQIMDDLPWLASRIGYIIVKK
ncbi:MAG: hypothetical protein J6A99_00610 [Clostridia bacterium]|nr:hypothetical protein [Clostridia bacterium]